MSYDEQRSSEPMGWQETIDAAQSFVGSKVQLTIGQHETPGWNSWAVLRGDLAAQVITRWSEAEAVSLRLGDGHHVQLPRANFAGSKWLPGWDETNPPTPPLKIDLGAYGVMLELTPPFRQNPA